MEIGERRRKLLAMTKRKKMSCSHMEIELRRRRSIFKTRDGDADKRTIELAKERAMIKTRRGDVKCIAIFVVCEAIFLLITMESLGMHNVAIYV